MAFDLNFIRLKTHFKTRKFLVYNDSYHSGWQARVNDASVPVYRANAAFKGIWLPPGETHVLFRYQPLTRHHFYIFLEIYFLVFGLGVIIVFIRGCRENKGC